MLHNRCIEMDAPMTYKHNFLLKTGAAPYGKFVSLQNSEKKKKNKVGVFQIILKYIFLK
jgi:hypothetical protein